MRRRIGLGMLAIFVVLAAEGAGAEKVLVTPQAFNYAGFLAFCGLLNAGDKPVTVTIELVDSSTGMVLASQADCVVLAGSAEGPCGTTDFSEGRRYCRFTLTRGSPRKMRGSLEVNLNTDRYVVLPAQ